MAAKSLVALVCLVLIAVSAVPAGFTTYFDDERCPDGWYQLGTAQGRLIVSVDNAADSGVTVNKPLSDAEDRTHSHDYSTTVNFPSKAIAAIDCCDNQGACSKEYPVSGQLDQTPSGLAFVQMPLCTLREANSDPTPFGTIAYFEPSVSRCPDNWTPMGIAKGRVVLPGYATTGVLPSANTPLSSGEDRKHSHTYSTAVNTSSVSYEGVSGCCNNNPAQAGHWNITGTSSLESSGLPYIQLLTCLSEEASFNSKFPPYTLLFNEVGCPPGWNVSYAHSGRFVVALPPGGVPGATFGGASLRPGFSGDVYHKQHFAGEVQTHSCGVGLASGCCADGYAGDGAFQYAGTSDANTVALPYLSAPMCMQVK